jgi:hypothetical protein
MTGRKAAVLIALAWMLCAESIPTRLRSSIFVA